MSTFFFILLSYIHFWQETYVMPQDQQKALIVTVTNLKDTKSPVYLALYNNSQSFSKMEGMYKGAKGNPNGKSTVEIILPNLEPGTYAFAIYQDTNGNGKLDTGFMGIPKEPYALSNNFKPMFSGPTFEKCSFKFSGKTTNIQIEIIR